MPTISKSVAWGVPAVAATAVAAGLAIIPVVADASPSLPAKSAGELLANVANAEDVPFSGRVVQTSRLGLPEIPGLDGVLEKAEGMAAEAGADAGAAAGLGGDMSSPTDLLAVLTGSHNGQIWYGGEDQVRVALTVGPGQHEFIRNGRDVWIWQQGSQQAQHGTLPERGAAEVEPAPTPGALTPQQLAEEALAAVTPSTEVIVDGTARVAERDAYELVLKPKQDGSLIRQVRLALDSETYVPLRAQIFSTRTSEPAFEVSFSSISFETPDSSVFAFKAPTGTTVEELGRTEMSDEDLLPEAKAGVEAAEEELRSGIDGVRLIGEAWTSVIELKGMPADEAAVADLPLGTDVEGGKLFETNLLTAFVTDDGRVYAGAVTPEVLQAAAE